MQITMVTPFGEMDFDMPTEKATDLIQRAFQYAAGTEPEKTPHTVQEPPKAPQPTGRPQSRVERMFGNFKMGDVKAAQETVPNDGHINVRPELPPRPEELADDEVFDDVMLEAGYYGTDNMEGVCSILYTALWGMADVREWLKAYETHGLPTTMQPEVLQNAVDTYGKEAQVDVAIEEMSELIKALLKNRRAEHSPEAWDYEKTRQNIFEEIADVVIMLTQLLMIFGGRDAVQKAIDAKVERLATRLAGAAREAGADAAQDTLQSAT